MKTKKYLFQKAAFLTVAIMSVLGTEASACNCVMPDSQVDQDSVTTNEMKDKAPKGVVAVDLGLPSGTKWANVNLGYPKNEEDVEYQWGVIYPNTGDNFHWDPSNKPRETFSNRGIEKYEMGTERDPMFVDGTIYSTGPYKWGGDIAGKPKYDAATATWGGKWKMPTMDQMLELIKYCEWIWDQDRRGFIVKGKNNNSIFLKRDTYWSSTKAHEYSDGAYCMFIYDDDIKCDDSCNIPRYARFRIRPVSK